MADDEKFTTEHSARVYHDTFGYYVEVREDGDGLGLCEIVYSDGDGRGDDQRVNIGPWAMAVKVAEAIIQIAKLRGDQ